MRLLPLISARPGSHLIKAGPEATWHPQILTLNWVPGSIPNFIAVIFRMMAANYLSGHDNLPLGLYPVGSNCLE